MNSHATFWDDDLIAKYNYSGPRYTSYPTALEFNEEYTQADFLAAAARYPDKPLSLYLHIPFCHKLCYFCGCNKIITKNEAKVDAYLQALAEEIRAMAKPFKSRIVTQMHWGGGTPTFLNQSQISELVTLLRQEFQFSESVEMSIEIDPRRIELEMIDHLAHLGFNRLSLGIQDFNPEIQQLINRVQDESMIHQLILRARDNAFNSVSVDLIYGLPKQNVASFKETLDKVIAMSPDRLSVFNYAHLPARFPAQRKIKESDLPSPQEKLAILQATIEQLTAAGYLFIGMDHFAKPDDELAIAQKKGVLHRNFQGYTTQQEADLLGLGVSAISMIGDTYSQNRKEITEYLSSIQTKQSALWKGFSLSEDDCIRRDVIRQLICHFELDKRTIEARYGIVFDHYFSEDLALLAPLVDDHLLTLSPHHLVVSNKGRLLIRNICVCFDRYMRHAARQQQFSRII